MVAELFNRQIRIWDEEKKAEKDVLLLDNCIVHISSETSHHIRLVSLLANSTSTPSDGLSGHPELEMQLQVGLLTFYTLCDDLGRLCNMRDSSESNEHVQTCHTFFMTLNMSN